MKHYSATMTHKIEIWLDGVKVLDTVPRGSIEQLINEVSKHTRYDYSHLSVRVGKVELHFRRGLDAKRRALTSAEINAVVGL